MRSRIGHAVFYSLFCLLPLFLNAQTTIDQTLQVITNDMTNGGNFQIQLKIKGTNLPSTNTLGSATVDITYDSTKLTYVNSSNWAFDFGQGYNRSATDNNTFVRILVTGGGVNENGGGDPPGFDITTTYVSWVQLNFTIADANGSTDLTINPPSNAIGLFENHQNEPDTGVITDQTLSQPINIQDEPLSVTTVISSEPNIPEEFKLNQNYPNPFNPDTRVEFGVPDRGNLIHINIDIYNILGERVRTLANGRYQPGYHYVIWDGRNNHNQQLASGVYFLRLQNEFFVKIRKMLLVR